MWIKICGLKDEATVAAVCEIGPRGVGADAIGLNFYAPSVRSVSKDVAVRIGNMIPPEGPLKVGVFVNHGLGEIEDLVGACGLNAVQLHGDEPPVLLADLAGRLPQTALIRAWRMKEESLADLNEYLTECRRLGVTLWACLIDAYVTGTFGGSGKTVAWSSVSQWQAQNPDHPQVILAGGLEPRNVAKAIEAGRPWGVDVASGVESSPGVKDLSLVRQFITNVRASGVGS